VEDDDDERGQGDRGTAADMDKTERTDLLQGVKTETTDRQTDRQTFRGG